MKVDDKGIKCYKGKDKYIYNYDYGEVCIFDTYQERLLSRYKIRNNNFDSTKILDKKIFKDCGGNFNEIRRK